MIQLKPRLLMHGNIPRPLHGLNPRTIMGKAKWDELRQKVKVSQEFQCKACGVKSRDAWPSAWLEGHESYSIDYEAMEVKIDSIVSLCPACHKFIHSGFLSVTDCVSNKTKAQIVQHGFDILKENSMYVSKATAFLICNGDLPEPKGWLEPDEAVDHWLMLGPDWFCEQSDIGWGKWKLFWEDNWYDCPWKSEANWAEHYGR